VQRQHKKKSLQVQLLRELLPDNRIFRPYIFTSVIDTETKKAINEQQLNVCSMGKNPGLNLFVRLFYDAIQDKINFAIDCPFKQVR